MNVMTSASLTLQNISGLFFLLKEMKIQCSAELHALLLPYMFSFVVTLKINHTSHNHLELRFGLQS